MAAAQRTFLFSSEHVAEGHPDKMCDQVSDAVLDACLAGDKASKVACESASKTGLIMVFGEITTSTVLDYQKIIRGAIKDIGFTDAVYGMDYKSCNVLVAIEQQSPDICQGVFKDDQDGQGNENLGAGDQGLMFGYATDETECLMPLSYELARNVCKEYSDQRNAKTLAWAGPDAKTQVTVKYALDKTGGKQDITPLEVDSVLISAHHLESATNEEIRKDLKALILKVIPANLITEKTKYHLNPSGRFTIGGPQGDAGLTGRKIIVDTYGGWGAHGGGAFSGKDPSKVDRSACYAARWVAKSIVAQKLAKRVLVQVAYSIGVAEPLSVHVESYGTGIYDDMDLLKVVNANFDLRPYHILKDLDLWRPIYYRTARFGHFGRKDAADEKGPAGFTWENAKALTIPDGLVKL